MLKKGVLLVVVFIICINFVSSSPPGCNSPGVMIFGTCYDCQLPTETGDGVCPACYLGVDCEDDPDCDDFLACVPSTTICDDDEDCTKANQPFCNLETGLCVECLEDENCGVGEECVNNVCEPLEEDFCSLSNLGQANYSDCLYLESLSEFCGESSYFCDELGWDFYLIGNCECVSDPDTKDCIIDVDTLQCDTNEPLPGCEEAEFIGLEQTQCVNQIKTVTYVYDLDGDLDICSSEADVDCSDPALLPFFGFWNFIVTFLVIALIYFFVRRK